MQKTSAYKLLFMLMISLLSFSMAYAQFTIPPVPKKQTSLYDYANLLKPEQAQQLEQKLLRYSDSTSTQIVVIIVPTIENEDIGILTPKWAHTWGIGQAKEDNGVLMLMAVKERRIHISPGYGAEVRMTAGQIGEMTRTYIIPEFKEGRYYEGLDRGTDGIFEMLKGEFKGSPKSEDGSSLYGLLPLLLFFILIIAIASRNKNNGGGGGRGGNRSPGLDLSDIIILSSLGRGGRSSGGFGSGGGFGGGGFSGGFGGGGFSGGGAGGSW